MPSNSLYLLHLQTVFIKRSQFKAKTERSMVLQYVENFNKIDYLISLRVYMDFNNLPLNNKNAFDRDKSRGKLFISKKTCF